MHREDGRGWTEVGGSTGMEVEAYKCGRGLSCTERLGCGYIEVDETTGVEDKCERG